ncbi:hypothetical protein HY212_06685 [Candidatus Pacearchaeota archaeon]|nr:hypothetical protein [Candidatus Pacearchaeota archaeon]
MDNQNQKIKKDIENALKYLRNPVLVAASLKLFELVKETNYDLRRGGVYGRNDQERQAMIEYYEKVIPWFERFSRNDFPSDEEFGQPLPWHNEGYPIDGIILHEVGGVSSLIGYNEDFVARMRALSGNSSLKNTDWILNDLTGIYIPLVKKSLEELTQEGIAKLRRDE